MKRLSLILLTFGLALDLAAEDPLENGKDRIDTPAIGSGLCVHNLFQSNMVLQRDRPIRLRGWASPGETVTVSFGGQSQSVSAAEDRTWRAELPAMPASAEPRTLTVQGKDDLIELTNLLVGDVWLLGGQSNMEFEIAKLEEGPLEILSANFDQIRLFTVPQQNGPEIRNALPRLHQWSSFSSRHFRQGYWEVCSPETVPDMSGIGYIFARRIHMATQVPIGLVDVSRGGTSLMTWTPIELLREIDTPEVVGELADWDKRVAGFDPVQDLENRIRQHHDWVANLKARGLEVPADRQPPTETQPGPAEDMNRPGNCYAGTLSTIAGLSVKGALWHQGYNDALMPNGHRMYARVFPEMIRAWRAAFDDPAMPFGIITQETEGEPQTLDDFLPAMVDEGIYIREVHYRTFLDLRKAGDQNIGYAATFDLHRAWYHPQIKIPAGERMAKWALATQYGKNIRWLPPQLQELKTSEGKLFLKFDGWVSAFHDGPIQGFAIAGEDGRFQPAAAAWFDRNGGKGEPNWERSIVVLSSPLVPKPVYFRYAWARNPLENLKSTGDGSGLPFDTQRNDDFTLADIYRIYTGKKPSTPGMLNRGETNELITVLKAEDLKRRQGEAKSLIDAK